MTVPVHYLDPEPEGLVSMIGGIIQANLEQRPERAGLLSPPAVVSIRVPDVPAEVSIRLTPEEVQVRSGMVTRWHVLVQADSETLLGLSSVPLRFGLPDLGTRAGRRVLGQLMRRRLRIQGMMRHPKVLARLNKLLSVG
jgi:hypothetical protein